MTARGLHRASPLANGVFLCGAVGAVLSWPEIAFAAATLAVTALLALISSVSLRELLPGRRFVLGFALVLFVAQVLSVRRGDLLLASPVRVTAGGLLAGGEMALRFLVVLTTSALFVRTTDPDRLADRLVQLRIPYRYAYLIVLALRFVPFFEGELRAVRDAQKVRGLRISARGPRRLLQAARWTIVPVVVSGLHRVDAIAISMKGRCFGLRPRRTSGRDASRSAWSLLPVTVGVVLVACAIAARAWRWGQ